PPNNRSRVSFASHVAPSANVESLLIVAYSWRTARSGAIDKANWANSSVPIAPASTSCWPTHVPQADPESIPSSGCHMSQKCQLFLLAVAWVAIASFSVASEPTSAGARLDALQKAAQLHRDPG